MSNKEVVQLMLKSSDNNPYTGKLSEKDNLIAAIDLARLYKDFADKGQFDEAINISSEQWVEVIQDLEKIQAEIPTPPVQEPIAVNKENKRALRIAKNILVKNRSGSLEDWIKNIIDGLEEYKSSAPAPEITNEMKPVYNNAELKLKILLDNGIEFDRIGYSVKAVDENSLLAAMEEYRQQSSFGYSYEDMMDIAGWMAAADNKKPIHELKEEAENYIKTKKEYRQQGQGVDGWISVEDRLPECSEKFYESDYVLCYCISGQFVGWYNSKLNEWYVSHFLAATVPLSYDSIPTHWQPLPLPPTPPNIKNK